VTLCNCCSDNVFTTYRITCNILYSQHIFQHFITNAYLQAKQFTLPEKQTSAVPNAYINVPDSTIINMQILAAVMAAAARRSVAPGANVRPAAPPSMRSQPTRECGELPSVLLWQINLVHFKRHRTPLVDGYREL